MNSLIRYVHGSEDSIDLDVYYVMDSLPSFFECQKFCFANPAENRNIIVIEDGIVAQCFKGTVDEINNGLIATYPLHSQDYPLLVTRKVKRDVGLKIIRVLRCLLSYCSRSQYREQVKAALKSSDWAQKVRTLNSINFLKIKDYGKAPLAEVYKVFAFQLGQINALIYEGKELYTKSAVAAEFPELRPFLYREQHIDSDTVSRFLFETIGGFAEYLTYNIYSYTQEGDVVELWIFDKYDLKTEKPILG